MAAIPKTYIEADRKIHRKTKKKVKVRQNLQKCHPNSTKMFEEDEFLIVEFEPLKTEISSNFFTSGCRQRLDGQATLSHM